MFSKIVYPNTYSNLERPFQTAHTQPHKYQQYTQRNYIVTPHQPTHPKYFTEHFRENFTGKHNDKLQDEKPQKCNSSTCGSGAENLFPVMDPRFNLREIAKNFLLLELHLCHPKQRCQDCIKKHFLTCEALAEEAAQIDVEGRNRSACEELAENIRKLESEFVHGKPPCEIAQAIRILRKPLVQETFDMAL